ncbi:triose-phosphate isomerase [Alsobacter sp. KACC 23698]|uniref:Triosephosphate isomerase n=1 Tax=Alsobacter sp. KACC 23698 TaxID=3149229 RepID=A0AAU7JMJ4_9HYPH
MTASARPRPLVAGNWKMNGLKASLGELSAMAAQYDEALTRKVDLLVCPPATLVAMAAAAVGAQIAIGGQDCHAKPNGAHTGDVSAEMLADLGATHVIVGHSERRTDHRETDADVRAKAEAAWRAGLTAILCVGETKDEREAGKTLDIVKRQLRGSIPEGATAAILVVAYEPVWAIGTGVTPTAKDVEEVHAMIRAELRGIVGDEQAPQVRILYGGSVKPSNAAELMAVPDVDGALVGGASLKAADFMGIAAAYR